jgi:hypothetical protein
MDLKEEDVLGPDVVKHWYYVSKGRALLRLLRNQKVAESLDVGAGSGVFSRVILDAGISRSALCVDPGYKKEYTESHQGKDILFTRSIDKVSQKLILMMDVLEHVDDDVGLLREYTENMPDDGLVVISVPAFQFLWSGHDVFLEHRRRYTRRTINKVVADAGLEVVDSRYFFGLLFPVVATMRLIDRWRLQNKKVEAKSSLKKHSALINSLLIVVHKLECAVIFPLNRLAGLTVFCVARRR